MHDSDLGVILPAGGKPALLPPMASRLLAHSAAATERERERGGGGRRERDEARETQRGRLWGGSM